MSAPFPAKLLDPAVAQQLLAKGDDTSPPALPTGGLKPLHAVLQEQRQLQEEEEAGLTDSDNGILSDPEETIAQEERLEKRVATLRKKLGLASDVTLKQVFKLLDCLIGQYKLNRTDEILQEIGAVCKERGGDWKVKWIQSTAFCRWKQYRFQEALELFLEQQSIVGASAALCENIGHTLSSLGDLPQAEEYFERAIELMKHGSFGNRGGIYMGLGLVRDRLGKTREAVPILTQALEHYQREHTKGFETVDSSIIAKAHMSLGKVQEKLGELDEAAKHMAEAMRIFKRTVGDSSPLTAHSMGSLGKVKASLGGVANRKEALSLLKQALALEVAKDAFHLETVWELLTRLKDLQMDVAKERQARAPTQKHGSHLEALKTAYAQYLPLVAQARARIAAANGQHERDDLGTLAVFCKTAGELCMLAQDYLLGEELLREALAHFERVPNFDCAGLIEGCNTLLQIAEANNPRRSGAGPSGTGPSEPRHHTNTDAPRKSKQGDCRWDD